jgi:hypothetical protein
MYLRTLHLLLSGLALTMLRTRTIFKSLQLPLSQLLKLCLLEPELPKSRYASHFFVMQPLMQFYSKASGKRNPIYLFYEVVTKNAEGLSGKPRDKHYKCYHGNQKVLTIT